MWAISGAARSAEPDLVIARVEYANAAVLIEVNGVPAFLAGEANNARESNGDNRGLISTWMVDGDNDVSARVEKRGTGDLKVTVTILVRGSDAPVAMAEITEAGVRSLPIKVNLPRWSWQDAAAWNGDDKEVLAAVDKLYRAVSRKDDPAIAKMTGAFWKDMAALLGPPALEAQKVFTEALGKATIRPMPPLKMARYQKGQLIHVGPSDGSPDAPVSADLGDGQRLETGEWWALIGGSWQVIH
jgi:hypothetical protein